MTQTFEHARGPGCGDERPGLAGVDVVIPCYQYGRFLRDCVTSVLTQGIRNVRIIIIDNASTDNSVEVARQLAGEDRRVEVVAHRHNLGQHASYNEGVDWARSEYFVMLDADDLLAPGCLKRAVAVMEQRPDVSLTYGRAALIGPQDPVPAIEAKTLDESWRIVSGKALLVRFCRTGRCHIRGGAAVVVRTAMQKLAGYYRPELSHSDDFELWMRLACLGAVAETNAVQAIFRNHELSRYVTARQLQTERDRVPLHLRHDIAAFVSFFSHEGASLPEAGSLHRLAKRGLGARAYWSALAHLCRGQAGVSWELLWLAFALRPSTALLPPVAYLFRREDAMQRLIAIASGAVRWPGAPARPAGMGS